MNGGESSNGMIREDSRRFEKIREGSRRFRKILGISRTSRILGMKIEKLKTPETWEWACGERGGGGKGGDKEARRRTRGE